MGNYSKKLEKRVLTRGPEYGFCVICGEYAKLTRDHVPPEGCNNNVDVVLQIFQPESAHSKPTQKTFSQGGTHFRTLCERCNSYRLGAKYDPELVRLSNEVTNIALATIERKIVLPQRISAFMRPQKVARSVIGHILAATAVEETKKGPLSAPFQNSLRHYFLNEDESLPAEVDIYYWVYPSRRQVVVKNSGKLSWKRKGLLLGHILKFLPLGFWVLWERPKNISLNLSALVPDKNMGIDQLCQVDLDIGSIPRLDFPEAPNDDEAILLRDDATSVGYPKTKI
jgi:hypothetical protein